MNKLFLYGILFLYMFSFVNAFDLENVLHYYSFQNDTYGTIFQDRITNLNATVTGTIYNVTGKIDNGILTQNLLSLTPKGNVTIPINTNHSFSINLWHHFNHSISSFDNIFYIGSQNLNDFYLMYGVSTTPKAYFYKNGTGTAQSIINISSSVMPNFSNSNYVMYSLTYSNETNILCIFVNSIIGQCSNMIFNKSLSYLILTGESKNYYDEVLITNETLFMDDIFTLYNYGNGLDYNGTLNNTFISPNSTLVIVPNTTSLFSKKQCMDDKYFCNNTLYTNFSGEAFYCPSENVLKCNDAQGCIDYIMNLNTGDKSYFQLGVPCSTLKKEFISSLSWNTPCIANTLNSDLAGVLTLTFPVALQFFIADCINYNYIVIPTANCEYKETPFVHYTNDPLYTEGECFNLTPIENLCPYENAVSCADNTHIQKCVNDSSGFLSWNVTQCLLNFNCVGGRCQFVPKQCYADNECSSNETCDITTNKCISASDSSFYLSVQAKYWILIIVCSLFLIIPMMLAGKEGVLGGLALSSVLCISMTIIFGLSLLIPIVYTLLAGGVFAIIIRGTFT